MQPRAPLLLLSLASLVSFGFSNCGTTTPTEPIPPPIDVAACSTLAEAECNARPDCEAQYTDELCACPAICEVDPSGSGNCFAPPCDCQPPTFAGCATHEPCSDLDRTACQSDNSCQWLPAPSVACLCAPCDAAVPNCECHCPQPNPDDGVCVPADPCANLPEDQCVSTAGCEPIYGTTRCGGGEAPPGSGDRAAPCEGPECFSCDPVTEYLGCQPEGPTCGPVCDIYCEFGNQYDANGCELCACNPPPPDRCEGLDEASCLQSPACEAHYEGAACDAACRPDPNGGCLPCDPAQIYSGCFPRIVSGECNDDTQCPNGYCSWADGSGFSRPCQGTDCDPAPPPPAGICIYPSCDDGPVLCDAIQPSCAPGEVAAARNGCWQCVDARTCGNEPPPPPVCTDGSTIACFALPPMCPAGTEPGISNGCWTCVEPSTCQAIGCQDGTEIACRSLPPICDAGQTLSIVNSCWACLDASTCQ